MASKSSSDSHMSNGKSENHYKMLGWNLIISALVMYLAMFSMIDGVPDFFNNVNMFYMMLIMVAPMGILMLWTMRSMYDNRKANIALYAGFALLLVAGYVFTREQTLVGDTQFLRSMIPHHSGAILMCREAQIKDPDVASLCTRIIQSQKEEIEEMKSILSRLKSRT